MNYTTYFLLLTAVFGSLSGVSFFVEESVDLKKKFKWTRILLEITLIGAIVTLLLNTVF